MFSLTTADSLLGVLLATGPHLLHLALDITTSRCREGGDLCSEELPVMVCIIVFIVLVFSDSLFWIK